MEGGMVSCQWSVVSGRVRSTPYRVAVARQLVKQKVPPGGRLATCATNPKRQIEARQRICAHRRGGLTIYVRFLENSRRWSEEAHEHLRMHQVSIYAKFFANCRRWSRDELGRGQRLRIGGASSTTSRK